MIPYFDSDEWIFSFDGLDKVYTTIVFEEGAVVEIYDNLGEKVDQRYFTVSIVRNRFVIDMRKEGSFVAVKYIEAPASKNELDEIKPKEVEGLVDTLSKHTTSLRVRAHAQGLISRPANRQTSTSSVIQPDYNRPTTFKGREEGVELPFIEGNDGVIGGVLNIVSSVELDKGPIVVSGFLENFTSLTSFNTADATQKTFLLRKAYDTDEKAIRREVTGLKKKNLGLYQSENLDKFQIKDRFFYTDYRRTGSDLTPSYGSQEKFIEVIRYAGSIQGHTLHESFTGSTEPTESQIKDVFEDFFGTRNPVRYVTKVFKSDGNFRGYFGTYSVEFFNQGFGAFVNYIHLNLVGNNITSAPFLEENKKFIKKDLKTLLFGSPDITKTPQINFLNDTEEFFFGLNRVNLNGEIKTSFTYYDPGNSNSYNEFLYNQSDRRKRPYNSTLNTDTELKGVYPSYDNSYTLSQNNISLTYPTGITGKLWYVAIPKDQVVNEAPTVIDHFSKDILGFRLYDGWKYQMDFDVRVGSLRYKKTLLATNQASTRPNTSSDIITANVYEDQDFIFFVGSGTPPSSFNFQVVKDMTSIPVINRFQWDGKIVKDEGLEEFTYPRVSTFNNFYSRLPTTFIPKI